MSPRSTSSPDLTDTPGYFFISIFYWPAPGYCSLMLKMMMFNGDIIYNGGMSVCKGFELMMTIALVMLVIRVMRGGGALVRVVEVSHVCGTLVVCVSL